MRSPNSFPVSVRRGSVVVKIYRQDRLKAGAEYSSYMVTYTGADRKRKQKAFADYNEAKEEAQGVAQKLSQGEIQVAQLTSSDRRAYGHALAELQPTGAALELAAKEYAEAHKILAGRTSLVEAARFYVARHQNCTAMDVKDAIEELYQSKKQEGASDD